MNTATIKARKSVRTFTDQRIAPETIAELERFIANDANPFGVPITFRILDREKYGLSSPVILGAETYIGAKGDGRRRRRDDAGGRTDRLCR